MVVLLYSHGSIIAVAAAVRKKEEREKTTTTDNVLYIIRYTMKSRQTQTSTTKYEVFLFFFNTFAG